MVATAQARERYPYRMKDLCELTGLSRQAIHFYVQQGLVPPGHKTGRNMAWYGEEHLARLELIRKLQHERFLPLKAIRALLEGQTEAFAPVQRRVLRELKTRLSGSDLSAPEAPAPVDAAELAARCGVDLAEVKRMAELGIIGLAEDRGALRLASSDAWMVELWGDIRRAGFTREHGFEVDDMAVYADAIVALFDRERELLLERLAHLPPERLATMLEAVLPLIHAFLARYHTAQLRNLFVTVE